MTNSQLVEALRQAVHKAISAKHHKHDALYELENLISLLAIRLQKDNNEAS